MPDVVACYGIPLYFIVFFGIFIHYWRSLMSEALYLHHRGKKLEWQLFYLYDLHQTLTDCVSCLIDVHILICWPTRCNYKLRKVLWFNWVLWRFQCLERYSSSNFHKFCGKSMKIISTYHLLICYCILWRYVEHKSKPMCKHLWLCQSGFYYSDYPFYSSKPSIVVYSDYQF